MEISEPLANLSSFFKKCPLSILLAIIVLYLCRNKYGHGISQVPGPWLASWTDLWRLNNVAKGQSHLTMIGLHKKYGKLVRIAPNVVDVSDPAMIPVLYNAKGTFKKTDFYPLFALIRDGKTRMNLFSTTDETWHREKKRNIANAYSMTSLLEMEDAVDDCSKLFMQKLGAFADNRETINLGTWLQYYAFDVVGELTFQRKFGFLEEGKDVDGVIKIIQIGFYYASTIGQVPGLHKFLLGNFLLPWLFPQLERWNQVLQFTLRAVDARTSISQNGQSPTLNPRIGKDFLARYLATHASNPLRMSKEDIIQGLLNNVFAGSDTTAIALRAIIYYLCKTPYYMSKLVQELDDNEYRLSPTISYRESRECLPYLNAVIKEGLRIHPSIGLLLERYVPDGGAIISGTWMPAGTKVGINAWVLHYDGSVFEQPERFWPERWLIGDEKKLAEMERSFFVFGAGSRTCIGKNMSMMEFGKIIPQILREFEIELVNEEWKVDNRWFVLQSGLDVRLKRRFRNIGT